MSQYWLISVPNENKNEAATRGRLAAKTRLFCDVKEFKLPLLKVGTLDALVQLSDETSKIDSFMETTVKKLERTGYDLVRNSPNNDNPISSSSSGSSAQKSTAAVELKINDLSADDYVQRWQWDEKRYSSKNRSIGQLTDTIYKDATKSDEELKTKMAEYNDLKSNLTAVERKETGSLLVKPLGPYIKKSDIIESEHLTTLFIVVPKNKELEFQQTYETMEDLFAEREAEKQKEKESRQKERDEARALKAAKVAADWAEKTKHAKSEEKKRGFQSCGKQSRRRKEERRRPETARRRREKKRRRRASRRREETGRRENARR